MGKHSFKMAKSATSHQNKPKAVLLTGGAGFIGSHVASRIVQQHRDINVVVYDSLEYCASIRNLDAIRDAPNF
jgi:dTDP-D-glucose 4,6-dehydratase